MNIQNKRTTDIIIICALLLLISLGYNTLQAYKDNIDYIKTHPCDICREQGNLIINISQPNDARYIISNDDNEINK